MTFCTLLYIFNWRFQPDACNVKCKRAGLRDEVENSAGMIEDDAEKRDVSGCFPIGLDKTDHLQFKACHGSDLQKCHMNCLVNTWKLNISHLEIKTGHSLLL